MIDTDSSLYPYVDQEQQRLDYRSWRIFQLGGILYDPQRVQRWARAWRDVTFPKPGTTAPGGVFVFETLTPETAQLAFNRTRQILDMFRS